MGGRARYDTIGRGYARVRGQDPRIAAPIFDALAGCASVVNVGAGTGSYEPRDRPVVAVEPSDVMIRQRGPGTAPVVRGTATALPFADGAFDASLAILTLHHWPDLSGGLRELQRASRKRVVILTFDTAVGGFWLTDYFPEILEIDAQTMPSLDTLRGALGDFAVHDVPIPHDCRDGLLGGYWRRPEAYLDEAVRNGMSVFARVEAIETGVDRLAGDLESGAWQQRYGWMLGEEEIDLGYRLIVAPSKADAAG